MPLFIENTLVHPSTNFHPSAIFSKFKNLHKVSNQFIQNHLPEKNKIISGNQHRLLYICQHEYAAVSKHLNKGDFQYIASDDATTCHVVIFIEPKTETICLGHFDGVSTKQGILSMISEIYSLIKLSDQKEASDYLHLYILGGFLDEKNLSEKLFSNILCVCTKAKENIHLQIACSYSVNNKYHSGNNYPLLLGAAVDIDTLDISIGTCTIAHRGPDMLLREARLLYGDTKREEMVCVYDNNEGCVYTTPFKFRYEFWYSRLLSIPDKEYLNIRSTSPHCEPDHFVERSKSAIHFVMKYRNDCKNDTIFYGKVRKCQLDENFHWFYIDPEHSELLL